MTAQPDTENLTKVTAYYTDQALRSLNSAAERTRESRTDAINSAVVIYDVLTWMAASDRNIVMTVDDLLKPGETVLIKARRLRRWRRWFLGQSVANAESWHSE